MIWIERLAAGHARQASGGKGGVTYPVNPFTPLKMKSASDMGSRFQADGTVFPEDGRRRSPSARARDVCGARD